MRHHISKVIDITKTATLRDTAVLFSGNIIGAFFGFLLLLVLARVLSVEDVGVFSALTNLVILTAAVIDPGITAGLINFIAGKESKNQNEYMAAAFKINLLLFILTSAALIGLGNSITSTLLATNNKFLVFILIGTIFANLIWVFTSQVLKARRRFLQASLIDVASAFFRLAGVLAIGFFVTLTLTSAASIYALGTLLAALIGLYFLGADFMFIKVSTHTYRTLLGFSGWLGVNRISSTIAGKIDVQMLAVLSGAFSTGLYSIPARLIFFVSLLIASFSSVIAPRLAAFETKDQEKEYIKKITMFSVLIISGLLVWYIVSEPFIIVLFGEKYRGSIEIFRLLLISTLPFVLTTPSVNAIIYSLKKPKYIGYFSVFQLLAVVIFNFVFIPLYGAPGPAYSLIIVNSALALYSWAIIIKHYR